MSTTEFAERVKRLRERHEQAVADIQNNFGAAYSSRINQDNYSIHQDRGELLDELERLERERGQIDMLHAAIAHGDDDHRQWLYDAIKAHFAGEPVPAVYGRGKLEARCEAAETKVAKLEADLAAITTERDEAIAATAEALRDAEMWNDRALNPRRPAPHPIPGDGREGARVMVEPKCEDCGSTEDVMQVKVRSPHLLCRRCVATLPAEVLKLAEIKAAKDAP